MTIELLPIKAYNPPAPPLKPGWYVWPIYGGGCNVLHVSADLKITAYPLEEGLQKWVKDSIE